MLVSLCPAHYVFPEEQEVERHEEEEVVRTVEEEALFRLAYPLIAELYAKEREEAHTNKLKSKHNAFLFRSLPTALYTILFSV